MGCRHGAEEMPSEEMPLVRVPRQKMFIFRPSAPPTAPPPPPPPHAHAHPLPRSDSIRVLAHGPVRPTPGSRKSERAAAKHQQKVGLREGEAWVRGSHPRDPSFRPV